MDAGGRKRKKFARKTYLTFAIISAAALGQWIIVCFVEGARKIFGSFYLVNSVTFVLAGLLFLIFMFNKNVRSHRIYSWIFAIIIIELGIFSMYVLVARTWVPEMLAYYFFCLLLMTAALIIGCNLSFSMDLTQLIAPLFIFSFILFLASAYFLVAHVFYPAMVPYAFLVFEICITGVMITNVMLHAQTIKGDRWVQMSLDDCLLAALMLFHEFLVIYALTFYWQINIHYFTSSDYFWLSTSTKSSHGTTPLNADYDDYDVRPPGDEWNINNETSYDWAADSWDLSNELQMK
ncbi:uncharacterized protein LOC108118179 [Drosophila eugracilis]|uniref:uncharacterized protein LOC108118179 n=1 Tax=Drosophila eugracilis TaxID=29029 RepID=UPI0007E895D4|nr:uncharacterized protein LOC108118179 [Drosophila eugracilis]